MIAVFILFCVPSDSPARTQPTAGGLERAAPQLPVSASSERECGKVGLKYGESNQTLWDSYVSPLAQGIAKRPAPGPTDLGEFDPAQRVTI